MSRWSPHDEEPKDKANGRNVFASFNQCGLAEVEFNNAGVAVDDG